MSKKTVTVSVVNNKAKADKDPLPAGTESDVKIEWVLDAAADQAGWKFTSTGITITSPGNQFSGGGFDNGNDKKYRWDDKNSDRTLYQYTIQLTNGTTTIDSDPAIQNGADSALI